MSVLATPIGAGIFAYAMAALLCFRFAPSVSVRCAGCILSIPWNYHVVDKADRS